MQKPPTTKEIVTSILLEIEMENEKQIKELVYKTVGFKKSFSGEMEPSQELKNEISEMEEVSKLKTVIKNTIIDICLKSEELIINNAVQQKSILHIINSVTFKLQNEIEDEIVKLILEKQKEKIKSEVFKHPSIAALLLEKI